MNNETSQNPPQGPKKNREWRPVFWYILITFVIVAVVSGGISNQKGGQSISFTEFSKLLDSNRVKTVQLGSSNNLLSGTKVDGSSFKTHYISYPEFVSELRSKGVNIQVTPSSSGWGWNIFIQAFIPFLLIAFLWFFIFRQAQGANNQALSFGKSRATPFKKEEGKKKVTFKDVAGADEAVQEIQEIVEFLKYPDKFVKIGAKIPKGVLLMGTPGTGKTLLAKAVAGEADVPFFNLSGSDFVEMFVGVGASRVRDLFAQAKKNAPSIIFVDEIDAVGRHRGAGLGGGHDEREQTLNQLLVEMDGFADHETVIVIAATNRPDILDPALLRPGRFDRQIMLDKPDIKGRHDILKIYEKNKKFARHVDLETTAKATPGFTGADLANLLNEAALLSARRKKKVIGNEEIMESIERVMAGPQRKSRVMSQKEKEIIAYHEVGHALVAAKLTHVDPVHKVSILPRGMALGYTMQLPEADKFLMSKEEILENLQVLLGGRVAEEIQFGDITSGASNDIERVTEMARTYICSYGMSEKLGPRKYGYNESRNVFLGKQYGNHSKDYSEDTARLIDEEILVLVKDAHYKTKAILLKHKAELDKIATVLLEKEILEKEEFFGLLEASVTI